MIKDSTDAPIALTDPPSKRVSFRSARWWPNTSMRTKMRRREHQCHPLHRCYNAPDVLSSHGCYIVLKVDFKCKLECYCHHRFGAPTLTRIFTRCSISSGSNFKSRGKVKCTVWTRGILHHIK